MRTKRERNTLAMGVCVMYYMERRVLIGTVDGGGGLNWNIFVFCYFVINKYIHISFLSLSRFQKFRFFYSPVARHLFFVYYFRIHICGLTSHFKSMNIIWFSPSWRRPISWINHATSTLNWIAQVCHADELKMPVDLCARNNFSIWWIA